MRLRRVAVLGGGPGGLYAARLLKLADPDCEVEVYEQGRPDTTFGFGVGLAAGTQRNLRAADPASLADILARGHGHDMSLRVGDDVARMPNDNLSAIARTTLLAVLQEHATAAGVRLRFGERVRAEDLDADLVIAADGVNSPTREARATTFGARTDVGEGLYLWCGTDFALPSAVFMPVTTEFGTFVTHAYPYAADRSTFLIETDETTWRAAGFDVTTDRTAPDASDDASLAYLQDAFRVALAGHRLIGNRTRWLRFRTVHCERWHDGHTVLLGDAAHTAHYSIGSGTKLAMEDAIALVDAVRSASDLPEALDRYEAARRPAVEHLQDIALRSQRWWDSFPRRTALPIHQLLVAYMTRAGKIPLARFAETAPDVVAQALTEYAGTPPPAGLHGDEVVRWVVGQPLGSDYTDRLAAPPGDVVRVQVDDPDPWGPKNEALVDRATEAVAAGATAVEVTGGSDRDALLDRLDVAERLRLEVGAPVVVVAPAALVADAVAGLVAGRTDLLQLTGPTA